LLRNSPALYLPAYELNCVLGSGCVEIVEGPDCAIATVQVEATAIQHKNNMRFIIGIFLKLMILKI
jgi:hypothetical protein